VSFTLLVVVAGLEQVVLDWVATQQQVMEAFLLVLLVAPVWQTVAVVEAGVDHPPRAILLAVAPAVQASSSFAIQQQHPLL
jgi:hypothetical protein